MTRETKPKITRRQVDNLRAESMRQASYLMNRLRMSVLGEPAIEKCKCGEEYEQFPNQPTKLDTAQINAIKFDVDKIYPGIVEEELDKVTDEIKSTEQMRTSIDAILADPGTYVLASVEAMEKARDVINARLANIIPIKKAGSKAACQYLHLNVRFQY